MKFHVNNLRVVDRLRDELRDWPGESLGFTTFKYFYSGVLRSFVRDIPLGDIVQG